MNTHTTITPAQAALALSSAERKEIILLTHKYSTGSTDRSTTHLYRMHVYSKYGVCGIVVFDDLLRQRNQCS